MEDDYNERIALLDEQTEASGIANSQLSRALPKFRNLRGVVASSFHLCLDREGIGQAQPAKVNHIARKTLMVLDGRL